MLVSLLANVLTRLDGERTEASRKSFPVFGWHSSDILPADSYPEDRGTIPNLLTSRLEVHRVREEDGHQLVDIVDRHPALDAVDCWYNGHMF